ncbi:MAG: hypothetical protein HYX88_01095 [Chloroflexi bacterium]|nr:hypothetical protein [Chloroflexota bacterium]
MVCFRSRIVHIYLDVYLESVYNILQERVTIFSGLRRLF